MFKIKYSTVVITRLDERKRTEIIKRNGLNETENREKEKLNFLKGFI